MEFIWLVGIIFGTLVHFVWQAAKNWFLVAELDSYE